MVRIVENIGFTEKHPIAPQTELYHMEKRENAAD